MKKIAIVVGLSLAGVANAAVVYNEDGMNIDLYGKTEARHQFEKGKDSDGKDDSYFRAGVKARTKLNEQFDAIGQYEGEYDFAKHGQRHQLRNRQAWAGFDGKDKGALTFGRQMGAIYNVSGMSDVAPEVLSGYTAAPDQGFLQRTDNVAQYKNTFNGVTVTGQYKLAGHGHKSIESGKAIHEGAGYATSIVADNINGSGVGAGAAFSTVESVSGKDTQVYSVGTNYNANNVYLAATHTGGKLTTDKRFRDDEVIGQYNFENGVSPSIGYIDTKTDVRKQYVETGLTYTFNKNVKAAVDAGWGVGQTNDRIIKSGVSYSW